MNRVLLLTHEYYPFAGGVARYCHDLLQSFNSEDYIVVTDHPELKNNHHILKMRLRYVGFKPSWAPAILKLWFLISNKKIKVIVTPNILPLGSVAYFFHKFFKMPYVLSLHGLDINLALKNKPDLTKNILREASYILVNSQSTAQIIEGFSFLDNKIKLFYPSVDLDINYDQHRLDILRKKYDLQADDKILLTVARLNKRKAQDLVIKAIANIKEHNIKYFIVGRGDFKAELVRLTKYYNLESNVFFIDDASDENLLYYYQLADIFVLPHRHDDIDVEGFGKVFLEAAACGLPIIAGNSGGVAEVWKDKQEALSVENENISQLIEAIRLLLNNSEQAERLGRAAKNKYDSWPRVAEQSAKFKELLATIV